MREEAAHQRHTAPRCGTRRTGRGPCAHLASGERHSSCGARAPQSGAQTRLSCASCALRGSGAPRGVSRPGDRSLLQMPRDRIGDTVGVDTRRTFNSRLNSSRLINIIFFSLTYYDSIQTFTVYVTRRSPNSMQYTPPSGAPPGPGARRRWGNVTRLTSTATDTEAHATDGAHY